jgi:hypothetical protein
MAGDALRIATYNVEWFNALFDNAGRLLDDDSPSGRYGVTCHQQLDALKTVFAALNADGIMVIEAPDQGSRRSTVTALEYFAAKAGLRARKAIIGFPSETEQEIAFLYDPDRMIVRHDPIGDPTGRHGARDAPRFDGTFRYDLDADAISETIQFSKPPLELEVTIRDRILRLIGVHAKSKAPGSGHSEHEAHRLGIENRRKQLAQCIWLRQRVTAHLEAGETLIVMGDFNDGPGIDDYEKLFGHSGVEIVIGTDDDPALRMFDPHATMAFSRRVGAMPSSARFYVQQQSRYFEALLDFILVSPDLCHDSPQWRIWHPHNDPGVVDVPGLGSAILTASDHFPVTLDLVI